MERKKGTKWGGRRRRKEGRERDVSEKGSITGRRKEGRRGREEDGDGKVRRGREGGYQQEGRWEG